MIGKKQRGLVVHHGQPWESLCATSLIKRLHKENAGLSLDWATTEDSYCLFRYNKKIDNIFIGMPNSIDSYDFIITLSEIGRKLDIEDVSKTKLKGFLSIDCPKDVQSYFSGNKVDKHILQILFRASGLSWRGDGYDLAYYPKNKTKQTKTGIAISNGELRSYVKKNLALRLSEPWHVPLKQDLLKRIDEINRCQRIITDDLFTVHAALALRKHVEFLDSESFNAEIEFFGHGNRIILNHEKWNV